VWTCLRRPTWRVRFDPPGVRRPNLRSGHFDRPAGHQRDAVTRRAQFEWLPPVLLAKPQLLATADLPSSHGRLPCPKEAYRPHRDLSLALALRDTQGMPTVSGAESPKRVRARSVFAGAAFGRSPHPTLAAPHRRLRLALVEEPPALRRVASDIRAASAKPRAQRGQHPAPPELGHRRRELR